MSLDERLHDADAETYRHLYVRQVNMRDPWLKDLLLKVIEDETAGVIMTSQSVEWLFHPYDGGMDIIANSPFERNKLAEKYKNWSS